MDGSQLIAPPRAEVRPVFDPIPVLDTARFEHMQRVATVMARSTLVPDTLRGRYEGSGSARTLVLFDEREILANCFLVVNQAVRWGMDPFAVAQCCSVVHGKLTFEGKLVSAVMEAKLGVALEYAYAGTGETMTVEISGTLPDGRKRTIAGSVAEWRTTGTNSPWRPATFRKMLAYRGAREWARMWAPAVMLGVYSDDEMQALERPMRDVTPAAPPPPVRQARMAPPPPPAPAAQQAPARKPGPPPPPPAPAARTAPDPVTGELPLEDPPLEGAPAILAHIADELGACGDVETLDEVWDGSFSGLLDRLSRSDRERAIGLYDTRKRELAA